MSISELMTVPTKSRPTKSRAMPRGRVRIIVILTIILLIVAAVTVYILVFVLKPAPIKLDPNNQFVQGVDRLQKQPVPDEPIQKAIFYAQLAQNYEGYGDTKSALTYFLKAQQVIDQNKLADQIVYYQAIADTYQSLGDTKNAKLYLELQLKHLQDYAAANPNDVSTKAAIDAVNKRLGQL